MVRGTCMVLYVDIPIYLSLPSSSRPSVRPPAAVAMMVTRILLLLLVATPMWSVCAGERRGLVLVSCQCPSALNAPQNT